MAVTSTGSVVTIASSANTGSQSVTVPSDATLMIVSAGGYTAGGEATFWTTTAITLNSVQATRIRVDASNSEQSSVLYQLANPAIGSQTFAWDWNGTAAVTEGTTIIIRFYKDVNTTTPIRSNGGQYNATSGAATTGALSHEDGDMVVATFSHYWGTGPVTWTGATSISQPAQFNDNFNRMAEAALSGASTVTVTADENATESGLKAISGAVIAAAAAGGRTTKNTRAFPLGMEIGMNHRECNI